MKPFALNMFVFLAALNSLASTDQPGAFDKINGMYEAAAAPKSIAELFAVLPKLKECAGSYDFSRDTIDKAAMPVKVNYHKPAFGPDFPAEDQFGIAFNNSKSKSLDVLKSFFDSYKSELTPLALELKTELWENELNCHIVSTCLDMPKTHFVDASIRMNDKYVLYKTSETVYDDDLTYTKDMVAYCWK